MEGFSSRNLRRMANKSIITKVTNNSEFENPDNNKNNDEDKVNVDIDLDCNTEVTANMQIENENKTISEKLSDWYMKYNPGKRCCDDLLKILRSENIAVPLSTSTLIGRRKEIIVRSVSPGEYFHLGVRQYLDTIKSKIIGYKELHLDIGIDGLPLFRCSQNGLWPIMGNLHNVKDTEVFLIGSYFGKKNLETLTCFYMISVMKCRI